MMIAIFSIHASQNIHFKMVWRLLRAPALFFDDNSTGQILTRFSTDIMATDFLLPKLLDVFMNAGFKVFAMTLFMIGTIPLNLVSVILIIIPMYMLRKYQSLAQSDCQRIESISKGPVNSDYKTVIDGITSIRAYKMQKFFTDMFNVNSDINGAARFTLMGVTRWFIIRLDILSFFFVFGSMFLIILLKETTNFLDLTLASLTAQFAVDFSYNVGFALKTIGKIENYLTSAQRIIEYTNLEQEEELEKKDDHIEWTRHPQIKFDRVYLRYKPHLPFTLKGISFEIAPGQKYGIIGRTGAGKSSILQAIFRLINTEDTSRILIGNINIREVGLH